MVGLFEEMVSDYASFAVRLCEFMGIDPEAGVRLLANAHENPRKGARTQAYVWLRAFLLPGASLGKLLPPKVRRRWHQFLEGGNPARAEFPAEWRRRIEEYYRADNQKLAERFSLPLRQHGYPM